MDAGDMTNRDRSLSCFFLSVVKFFSVVKPPEQMNAQTMLPPEAFPPRVDEYRP